MTPKLLTYDEHNMIAGNIPTTTMEEIITRFDSICQDTDIKSYGFTPDQLATYVWTKLHIRAKELERHNPMSSVELDTIHLEEAFTERLRNKDITFRVITWHGPSGHALIEYTGLRQDLVNLITEQWDDPNLCNDIKEIK